ncbi:hypothetical protein [Geitlerinema sp. PCC 7407]|uniref:hypothetical protein n=1 Tax=Geitlerinema sp. PCC 7407 TaxID=1173025 RepID=UPI00029FF3BF|nr:hypothetical protein [Geitlerinema sp. PCC 7407]AFY67858.1 hypothetical protein GEI7407_3391 [Geitlerinema sp. PCC 7407]
MGETLALSLLVGSLGLQSAIAGGWLYWRQLVTGRQEREEEENLTRYDYGEVPVNEDQKLENPAEAGVNSAPAKSAPASAGMVNGAKGQRDPRLVGWEFKIVRANRDLFRDSAAFRQLCKEEAEAGWILLEKLDDRRVRFKRPIALRDIIRSDYLSFDPYRSTYGPSGSSWAWLGAIAALTAILLPAYLGYTLVSTTLKRPVAPAVSPTPVLPQAAESAPASPPEQP